MLVQSTCKSHLLLWDKSRSGHQPHKPWAADLRLICFVPVLDLLKVGCFGSKCLRGIQSITQPPGCGRASPEEPAGGREDARAEANPQRAGLPDDPSAAHAGNVGSPAMVTYCRGRDGVFIDSVRDCHLWESVDKWLSVAWANHVTLIFRDNDIFKVFSTMGPVFSAVSVMLQKLNLDLISVHKWLSFVGFFAIISEVDPFFWNVVSFLLEIVYFLFEQIGVECFTSELSTLLRKAQNLYL